MTYRNTLTFGKSNRKPFAFELLLSFLLILSIYNTHAQEVIPTTGGNATGSGGTISYTIGQIIYTSSTGTNGSVYPGVQQPYELSLYTSIDDSFEIELICTAYPNPVNDFLTLEVKNIQNENLSYLLYDMNGRVMDSQRMTDIRTIIPMANFRAATYFLKIFNNHTEVKTFKIIKK